MATPGQNNPDPIGNFREGAAESIGNATRELLGTVDISKELDKKLKNVNSTLRATYNDTTKTRDALSDALDVVSKLGKEYLDVNKIQERITENSIKNIPIQNNLNNIYSDMLKEYTNLGISHEDALRTLGSEEAVYEDILNRMESRIESERKNVKLHERQFVLLMDQVKARNTINNLLEEAKSKVADANEQLSKSTIKATALSKIFAGLSVIPFLKDFMNFQVLSDKFQKSTGSGFKELGSQLLSIFKSPLFLLAAGITALATFVKLALDFDKIATSLANNLGMSKDSTVDMLDSFRKVSVEGAKLVNTLDASFLSVKNQANAMLELQSTLETNAMFTNQMLQNQILLTKQMGLSAEEATGIQKLSLLTGQSAEKILKTSLEQNKTSISYRKVIGEIAKINSEISVAYKNNPELIAKAVIEANKLGMSLEQTQKIAKSLLDFETSISGELESELLLGRRFNFEKARALALDGKSAEAATELITQIGGMNELTKMNVIQRERVAAAIGLSAEELATAAKEQAILNALGVQDRKALEERYEILRANNDQAGLARLQQEAAKKEGGALLLQDIARANLQQRFTESMEQLKQIFTEMSTALIPVLESIAKMISNTTALKLIMASIAGIAAAIATSMVIATGGAALVGAAIAAGTVGLGTYALMSSAGGQGEAALPTKRGNLPTANTGAAGNQGTAQGATERTTVVNLSLNSQDFATAIAKSDTRYA